MDFLLPPQNQEQPNGGGDPSTSTAKPGGAGDLATALHRQRRDARELDRDEEDYFSTVSGAPAGCLLIANVTLDRQAMLPVLRDQVQ